jgi:hypothetical protein
MGKNLTQPEEIELVVNELSDYFTNSEIENTKFSKTKSSVNVNDDECYIPLYKTSSFN